MTEPYRRTGTSNNGIGVSFDGFQGVFPLSRGAYDRHVQHFLGSLSCDETKFEKNQIDKKLLSLCKKNSKQNLLAQLPFLQTLVQGLGSISCVHDNGLLA